MPFKAKQPSHHKSQTFINGDPLLICTYATLLMDEVRNCDLRLISNVQLMSEYTYIYTKMYTFSCSLVCGANFSIIELLEAIQTNNFAIKWPRFKPKWYAEFPRIREIVNKLQILCVFCCTCCHAHMCNATNISICKCVQNEQNALQFLHIAVARVHATGQLPDAIRSAIGKYPQLCRDQHVCMRLQQTGVIFGYF